MQQTGRVRSRKNKAPCPGGDRKGSEERRIARQRRWNGRTRDKMHKVKRREEHTLRKPLFSHKNNDKPTVLIIILSVTC